jgi:hypothetical protein
MRPRPSRLEWPGRESLRFRRDPEDQGLSYMRNSTLSRLNSATAAASAAAA